PALTGAPATGALAQQLLPRAALRLRLAYAASRVQAPAAGHAATARVDRGASAPQTDGSPGDCPPPRDRTRRDRGGAVAAGARVKGRSVRDRRAHQARLPPAVVPPGSTADRAEGRPPASAQRA